MLLFSVAVFSSILAASITRLFLRASVFQATNWRGLAIPRGYGISFPLAQGFAFIFWMWYAHVVGQLLPTLALWGMAGIGLMDDLRGESPGGGFRRHLRALFQGGRLTIGFLKALLGSIVCAALGICLTGSAWGLLDGLFLALLSNAINLLDVRPGRAAKAAFLTYLVALMAIPTSTLPYLPTLLASALFFPADCKGQVMMGDVGAYPLGFALGMCFVPLSLPFKVALSCILLAFHLYCEFKSVSASIERNKILKWVDALWVRN